MAGMEAQVPQASNFTIPADLLHLLLLNLHPLWYSNPFSLFNLFSRLSDYCNSRATADSSAGTNTNVFTTFSERSVLIMDLPRGWSGFQLSDHSPLTPRQHEPNNFISNRMARSSHRYDHMKDLNEIFEAVEKLALPRMIFLVEIVNNHWQQSGRLRFI